MDPKDIRVLSLGGEGQYATSLQGQGSHNSGLVSGHKEPAKQKAYVHRYRKGWTHTYTLSHTPYSCPYLIQFFKILCSSN
jgi:hypothetical protein